MNKIKLILVALFGAAVLSLTTGCAVDTTYATPVNGYATTGVAATVTTESDYTDQYDYPYYGGYNGYGYGYPYYGGTVIYNGGYGYGHHWNGNHWHGGNNWHGGHFNGGHGWHGGGRGFGGGHGFHHGH